MTKDFSTVFGRHCGRVAQMVKCAPLQGCQLLYAELCSTAEGCALCRLCFHC